MPIQHFSGVEYRLRTSGLHQSSCGPALAPAVARHQVLVLFLQHIHTHVSDQSFVTQGTVGRRTARSWQSKVPILGICFRKFGRAEPCVQAPSPPARYQNRTSLALCPISVGPGPISKPCSKYQAARVSNAHITPAGVALGAVCPVMPPCHVAHSFPLQAFEAARMGARRGGRAADRRQPYSRHGRPQRAFFKKGAVFPTNPSVQAAPSATPDIFTRYRRRCHLCPHEAMRATQWRAKLRSARAVLSTGELFGRARVSACAPGRPTAAYLPAAPAAARARPPPVATPIGCGDRGASRRARACTRHKARTAGTAARRPAVNTRIYQPEAFGAGQQPGLRPRVSALHRARLHIRPRVLGHSPKSGAWPPQRRPERKNARRPFGLIRVVGQDI